jgi:hypothetical protein
VRWRWRASVRRSSSAELIFWTYAPVACRGDALDAGVAMMLFAVLVVGRDDAMWAKGLRCPHCAEEADIRAGLQYVCFVPHKRSLAKLVILPFLVKVPNEKANRYSE